MLTRDQKTFALTTALVLASGAAFTIRPGADGLAAAERKDISHEVIAPAAVEAASNQVALAFDVSGRIDEVLVAEGDRVEEGQVLARLDGRVARARLARAEAGLAAARARQDLARRGPRAEEIRAAEEESRAAAAQAKDAEIRLARSEKLALAGASTEAELDGARQARTANDARAQAAGARLDVIRAGTRVEAVREAKAAVDAAAAELEEARVMVEKAELRAPRAGVVLRRLAEPGEQVTTMPPKVIVTIADLDHLQLRAEVDEADVGRIAVGQTGYATAETFGERRFAGRVVRVMRELGRKELKKDDPRGRTDTRVLEVIFALDKAEEAAALPVGLRMDVHVETITRRDVVTVPIAAVARRGEAAEVVVMVGGKPEARPVELGADDGAVIEVKSGIAAGELVAVR